MKRAARCDDEDCREGSSEMDLSRVEAGITRVSVEKCQRETIRFRNRHHRHLQTKPSSPVNTAPHDKTQINPQILHLGYMNNCLSPHNLTLKPDFQYYQNNLTKLTPCPNPSPIQSTAVDPCSTENTDPENSTSTKNPLFSHTPNQIKRKPRHRCNKQHEP